MNLSARGERVRSALAGNGRRWFRRRRLRLRRRRRRVLPPISVLPTLCTLGNLVAGFAAIHYAARAANVQLLWTTWTPLTLAAALIFLGMLLDAFDGTLARLTRSSSELGGQLDSLADIVTFGVAPAFITLRLVQNYLGGEAWIIGPDVDNIFGKIIWAAAAVYVSCAALRLARFNIEMGGPSNVNDHSLFRGLPSPGAAGTVASLVMLHQFYLVKWYGVGPVSAGELLAADAALSFAQIATLGIPLIMLMCGFMMVSNVPYIHFANRYFRRRRSFAFIVRLVVIIFLAVVWFREMLALGFTAYALSGPVRMGLYRLRHKKAAAKPTEAERSE